MAVLSGSIKNVVISLFLINKSIDNINNRRKRMEQMEIICFQIIAAVGEARSSFIEAIQLAKKGQYEAAEKAMLDGEKTFIEGHHAHAKLVQEEAAGNKTELSLLLVHAEDQLMSAETFKILANEFIELYKKI